MTVVKKSILDRDIEKVNSVSDKVLRDNLSRVHYGKLAENMKPWTPETIALAKAYQEKYGYADEEYWRKIDEHRKERKEKLKLQKDQRIFEL